MEDNWPGVNVNSGYGGDSYRAPIPTCSLSINTFAAARSSMIILLLFSASISHLNGAIDLIAYWDVYSICYNTMI